MNTTPTRDHSFRDFSTWLSYVFLIFWLLAMLVFASFWDRFRKPFLIVFGSPFGAWGDQELPKCHQKTMRKMTSKKVGSEYVRVRKIVLGQWLGWVKGGGKPPPVWKKRRTEGIKKGRKEERKTCRFEGKMGSTRPDPMSRRISSTMLLTAPDSSRICLASFS